jgi:hypothetical protein
MSSYFDSTPPSDSYNVTRPYENGANKAAPTQFRALAFNDKRKDMMGRDIDLDNMPAETKQLRSAYGPETRFDDNVTSLDRTVVLNDMNTQDKLQQDQLAHMNGGKGAPVNPSTGMIQREPLKGYNNTTGQYFSMDPSGKKISNNRAVAWAEAIRAADDRKAAIVRGVNADARLGNESASKIDINGRGMGLAEQGQVNKQALDERMLTNTEANDVFDRTETKATNDITRKGATIAQQIASDEAINAMPDASALKDTRIAAAGGVIDPTVRARAQDAAKEKAVKVAIADAQPIQGMVNRLGAEVASGRLYRGAVRGNSEVTKLAGAINQMAQQVAETYKYDPAAAKAMVVQAVLGNTSSEKVPFYNELMDALEGSAVAPAAATSRLMNP